MPLPPQQSVEAQQLPLLSRPEEVGGDEHQEVMVSKNMVVDIGRVMARDGEKGMMGFMQMDTEKELLQQPPHQQQLQLPGAAAPTPWPSPQAPLPPQQSVEAQQLPLLSRPEEVGGDKHQEVMVSKNMVVDVGRVMARDGEKGMMGFTQMDKEKAAAAPAAATPTWCCRPNPMAISTGAATPAAVGGSAAASPAVATGGRFTLSTGDPTLCTNERSTAVSSSVRAYILSSEGHNFAMFLLKFHS